MAAKGRPDDGRSKHPLYALWRGMWKRCTVRTNGGYRTHGAKGVRVAAEWADFWRFVADMGDRPSPRHSLDRVNGSKVYGPGLCRWATPREQVYNSSRVRWLTFRGERRSVTEWAQCLGITQSALSHRIRKYGPRRALALGRTA